MSVNPTENDENTPLTAATEDEDTADWNQSSRHQPRQPQTAREIAFELFGNARELTPEEADAIEAMRKRLARPFSGKIEDL